MEGRVQKTGAYGMIPANYVEKVWLFESEIMQQYFCCSVNTNGFADFCHCCVGLFSVKLKTIYTITASLWCDVW